MAKTCADCMHSDPEYRTDTHHMGMDKHGATVLVPHTPNLERERYGPLAHGYVSAHCRTCGWRSYWHHEDVTRDMTTLQGVEAMHRCANTPTWTE